VESVTNLWAEGGIERRTSFRRNGEPELSRDRKHKMKDGGPPGKGKRKPKGSALTREKRINPDIEIRKK